LYKVAADWRGGWTSVLIVIVMGFAVGLATRLRRHPEGFLPIILDAGGKFFDSGEEGCEFPHAFVVQDFAPRRHTGVADSGSDSVEDVPLGIIKRLKDDLRRRRVKRILKRAGLLVESAVTEGAVHGVNLHAVDQIRVSSRNWIIDARSVTLHGGVQRAGSDAGFERRRGSVGSGGKESKPCNSQTEHNQDEQRENDA